MVCESRYFLCPFYSTGCSFCCFLPTYVIYIYVKSLFLHIILHSEVSTASKHQTKPSPAPHPKSCTTNSAYPTRNADPNSKNPSHPEPTLHATGPTAAFRTWYTSISRSGASIDCVGSSTMRRCSCITCIIMGIWRPFRY